MYTEVELAPEVRDFLDAFECPVRVLDGKGGHLPVSSSWRGHADGRPLADCRSRGLTIVSWGLDYEVPEDYDSKWVYVSYMPGEFYASGRQRRCSREFLLDRIQDEKSYMPDGAHTFARVDTDRRIVWFTFPLTSYANGGVELVDVDMYKLIGEPVERVMDATNLPRSTERAKALFIDACERAQNSGAANIEAQIATNRRSIQTYAAHIRNAYAEIRRQESELAVRKRQTVVCRSRLEERWDALLGHPKIARIEDNGTTLTVRTVPLDIENPNTGETAYLGVIDIQMRHESDYGMDVALHNRDNAKSCEDGMRAHPHCPQDGHPCWGGSEAMAADLMASYNVPALVEFIIRYLESYNPSDSWGRTFGPEWFGHEEDGEYTEGEDGECMCADCVREREHEAEEAGV
jgi:hypothetical protein